MSFTAAQYVQNGKNSNQYLGIFRYIKTSGVKSTKEGELYGFLQISSEGNFPAERVAHMAWDGVVEGYMYSQSKSISDSLKSGIQEFTRRVKDLMRNSKELEESGIDVSLTVVSATREGIYIANLGENEIFAYRGEKIVDVVDILEKNKAQTAGFMNSPQDLIIISTNSLLSENMHTVVGKNNREEILKSIALLGKTLLPSQGIFTIHFQKDGSKGIEENRSEDKMLTIEKTEVSDIPKKKEKKSSNLKNHKGVKTSQKTKREFKKPDLSKIFSKVKAVSFKIFAILKKVFIKLSGLFKRFKDRVAIFFQNRFGNKKWFKKYAARASEIRFKKKTPDIRIDGYKTKDLRTKRLKIVILATLAVVLIVGGYQYARKQRELRQLNTEAESIFSDVENILESAKDNLVTDRKEAERNIFSATNKLNEIPEGISEEYIEKKEDLGIEVLGLEDDLYKRVVVTPEKFKGFFDDNTELTDIEYVLDDSKNEKLIITDRGEGMVWELSIYDKSQNRMADNDGLIDKPQFVDVGNEGDIYIYDSEMGVLKAPTSSSGWSAFEKLTGVGINNIKVDNVGEFAVLTDSDNLYYLDINNSRIVKSVNYGTGYSSTTVNVISDENFSSANDFFADFSIYVLTSGDEGVLRYSAGSYVPISIVGVNGPIGDLTCGDTAGSMDFAFYMFDQTNRRILKLEKPRDSYNDKLHPNELVLLNQYVYRGEEEDMWSDVKDIVVDKGQKYIYLLDRNQVWRVGL